PDALSYVPSATFRFSAVAALPVTFRCALDGAPFAACSSPLVLDGLDEGAHTLQVQATDVSGNSDPVPASQTWRVHFAWQIVATNSNAHVEYSAAWLGTVGPMLYVTTPNNSPVPHTSVTYDVSTGTFGTWSADLCACGYTGPLVEASNVLYNFTDTIAIYDP